MNCKKCNAFVPDDSAFCPECGEKVEVVWSAPSEPEAQVFCPNCGAAMAAADGFCENCGTKVESAPAKAKKVGISPKVLKIGIAAVAVVLVLAIVIGLFAGGSAPSTVLYQKDDALFSADLPGGKPVEITDESVSGSIHMTEDGSRIFMIEDGELVYRPVGKKDSKATKIAKDVTSFKITSDGKKVFYIKNNNLYVHNLKDGTKIAKDVTNFYISADGKTVVYFVSDDGESVMYRKTGSNLEKADAKKLDSGVSSLRWFDEDLDTIYYFSDGDLYSQTGKKDKVKIASDAEIIGKVYDDGSFYYITAKKAKAAEEASEEDEDEDEDDGPTITLSFYNGKKSTQVSKEYYDWCDYAIDEAALLFTSVEGKGEDMEIIYHVATGTNLATLDEDDVASVSMNADGSKLLILKDYKDDEGTLYEAKVSGKKIGEPKKVVEDVGFNFGYLGIGEHYYFTDVEDNEGTLYIAGKKITDDVYTNYLYSDEDTGRLYFFTDVKKEAGSLHFTTGGKPTKVADDVALGLRTSPDGQMLYLADVEKNEGTLFVIKGKKGKEVDSEVTKLYSVIVVDEAY